MRVSARASSIVVVACALGLAACRKGNGEGTPSPAHEAGGSSTPTTAPTHDASLDGMTPPTPTAAGTARLVLQHVEATCMVAVGQPPHSFTVGVDLLVETALGEDGGARSREHVFCPKTLADGGKVKPRLDMWENCRRDAACVVTNDGGADAPGTGPIAVTCGKEAVELLVEDGKTVLRGSFGDGIVAPHPMRILPVVKARREAHVDC